MSDDPAVLATNDSAYVRWVATKLESIRNGKVMHCKFDPFFTEDEHMEDTTLTLPPTSQVSVGTIGLNFIADGWVAPSVTPGIHEVAVVRKNCVCGKEPQPLEVTSRELRFPSSYYFDVKISVPLDNGLFAKTEAHGKTYIPKFHVEIPEFGSETHIRDGEPIQVRVVVTASNSRCEKCGASCSKNYNIYLTDI